MTTGMLRTRKKCFGPRDHGYKLTFQEFSAGDCKEGYRCELIEGKLHVAETPEYPHDRMRSHVHQSLTLYSIRRRDVIGYNSAGAWVMIPRKSPTSCVGPDATVYWEIPEDWRRTTWQKISPRIVVEVINEDSAEMDYVCKRDLYQTVPSIREFWVFDRYCDEDGPIMRVYHRTTARQKWKIAEYGPRDTYITALLPGFKLPVCPPK